MERYRYQYEGRSKVNGTAIRFEIDTYCQCKHCDTCGVGYMGEITSCDDCGGELRDLFDGCGGLCWDDANMMAEYAIDDYLKHWDNPRHLRIEGRAMGWQRRSGWTDVTATWEGIREALSLDRADFRLSFTIEGDILTATRYSHDEPVGARFSIYPVKHLPDTMDLDEAIKLELVDEYGCHKGCGDYFYDCQCEGEGAR